MRGRSGDAVELRLVLSEISDARARIRGREGRELGRDGAGDCDSGDCEIWFELLCDSKYGEGRR